MHEDKYTRVRQELRTVSIADTVETTPWTTCPGILPYEDRIAAFTAIEGVIIDADTDDELTDDETWHVYITLGNLRVEMREVREFVGLHEGVRILRDLIHQRAKNAPEGSWQEGAYSHALDLAEDLIYAEARALQRSYGEGYCQHGTYVGGCGVDWLCGACEAGEV